VQYSGTKRKFRDWADYDREAQYFNNRYNCEAKDAIPPCGKPQGFLAKKGERRHGGINYQTPLGKLTEIQKQKSIKKVA